MDFDNLIAAFGLVFISELGDKTQLAIIGVSARSSIKWPVIAGAAAAFIVLALAASLVGALVGDAIPTRWVTLLAGTLFVGLGLLTLRSALRNAPDEEEDTSETRGLRKSGWMRAAISAFTLIFVAELGDKSQIAIASLAAESEDAIAIFVGSSLALTMLTVIGVLGGSILSRYVKPKLVELVAGLLFLAVGAFLIIDALANA